METFSETGEPLAWAIIKSSGFPDLDKAAAGIVGTRWQFTPMKMSGHPIKSAVYFAIEWKLPRTP